MIEERPCLNEIFSVSFAALGPVMNSVHVRAHRHAHVMTVDSESLKIKSRRILKEKNKIEILRKDSLVNISFYIQGDNFWRLVVLIK